MNETATKTAKTKYAVRFREEGRGPWTTRKFATLAEVQNYVRDRWQGVEYIDGPASFHTDYSAFEITGAKLTDDLGSRLGAYGTDKYWDWEWVDLSKTGTKLCALCGEPFAEHRSASGNGPAFCMSRHSQYGDHFIADRNAEVK